MTEHPAERRRVASAVDLLPLAELTDIRVYEVLGRRAPETQDQEDRQIGHELTAHVRGDDTWLETRARMVLHTEEADLVADAASIFTFAEPLDVAPTAIRDFVEKVGVMAVFPFLREQVFTTATRLGVPAPVVGLLRAGEFHVELTDAQLAEG